MSGQEHIAKGNIPALWAARPHLSAEQWVALYWGLRSLCMGAGQVEEDSQRAERFDQFFLRRVVDVTASELPSLNCVPLYFRWFEALFESGDELAAGFRSLEERSSVGRVPTLAELEDSMFRPSDALCVDTARKLLAGALEIGQIDDEDLASCAQQVADAIRQPELAPEASDVELPASLADYLGRKAAANACAFNQVPASGQILRIDALVGPAGPLTEDLARPLFVLVDVSIDVDGVWWGWMVGAEPSYACEWDYVLAPDGDPREPMAAVVQLWNPVRIYLPTVARVVGALSERRMAEIHALVADFLSGDAAPADAGARATVNALLVRRRTEAGLEVMTGPPLGDQTDVRRLYQTMYEAAADLVQQPAHLAAAAQAATAWLDRAAVRQTGVNRFVATAAHDPLLTLEVAFQFPGVGQAVLLTQMRDGERHRAPLTVLGRRIDFDGGVAVPSAEVAAKVATVMGLPDAYVRWAEVGAEFARTRRRMNGRTRGALHGLLQCVSDAALSPAHLFRFLFEPHGALRANGGSGAAPVVARMESRGPNSTRVHLWWLDPAPAIDRIDVFVAGKPVEPLPKVAWDERVETVEIVGMAVDVEAPAQAQLSGSSLRIEIG